MLKGFKEFVLRGNVVDLAVGVVIGAAFGSVVTALVKDLLTPLIAAIAKVPDFSGMVFSLNGSRFMYGDFVNALISFLLVAGAVYFFVVTPMNALLAAMKKGTESESATKSCPYCKTTIAKEAVRCPACTSQLPAPILGTPSRTAQSQRESNEDAIGEQMKDQVKEAVKKMNEEEA